MVNSIWNWWTPFQQKAARSGSERPHLLAETCPVHRCCDGNRFRRETKKNCNGNVTWIQKSWSREMRWVFKPHLRLHFNEHAFGCHPDGPQTYCSDLLHCLDFRPLSNIFSIYARYYSSGTHWLTFPRQDGTLLDLHIFSYHLPSLLFFTLQHTRFIRWLASVVYTQRFVWSACFGQIAIRNLAQRVGNLLMPPTMNFGSIGLVKHFDDFHWSCDFSSGADIWGAEFRNNSLKLWRRS